MADANTAGMSKERRFLLQCIRLYRDLPALWNVKSKVYHVRAKKDMAYKILLRKYREWFPEATRDDLKRKFNALRTNYRKELRKQMEALKSDTDPVYEPSLWYYKELAFLDEKKETDSHVTTDGTVILDDDEGPNIESHASTSAMRDSTPRDMTPRPVKKKHQHNLHDDQKLMNLENENLSDRKDEYYHWAMACAADLRKMERTQQLFAKKAIAEILMEGQLGELNRFSVKVNESQVYSQNSQSPAGHFSSTPSPSYIPCEIGLRN
ncbi:jg8719 [Pararge aegeria aegeria]|uniref:Jg8719 protein n=1 Tax=Pararge aegeria aegeria TaxID=348720 RepID=A0A8S4S6Y4_9NEOP|nr:jg8719 [Pararge aegeria aegeria]